MVEAVQLRCRFACRLAGGSVILSRFMHPVVGGGARKIRGGNIFLSKLKDMVLALRLWRR